MKFLIAGLGSIGRRHFRNLIALGETDILLYRTNKATLPDDELAGYPVETDLDAALAHKPDAVIISNPTALHMDVALPAARAGCHLFLEKPISHNLDGVSELVEVAASNGVKTLVGFQFRFHPSFHQIKAWLDAGEIGDPISVRAHWGEWLPGWHPWEDYRAGYAALPELGGGVIRTLCHPLDYLRMLLGETEVVACQTSNVGLNLPVEDTAEIALNFANGTLGQVHLNYNQRPARHDMEIVGTRGSIKWDNVDGVAHLYRADSESWETFTPAADFERNTLFLDQTKNFLAMLRDNEAPICSLHDGMRALELCMNALEYGDSKNI
jgi:predicted dehydrogenase